MRTTKNSFKITMKLGVCKHQSENPKFKFIKINKWVYFWYFGKTFQLLIHLILVYPICLFYFIKINVLKKWFSAFLPNCSKQHSTVWSNLAFPFSALFPITIFDVFAGHHPILSYPILSNPILSYPILSYPILS
jgi:hypothetical protein